MKAKILVLDIENAPNEGYFWDPWSRGPWQPIKITKPWYILCVGYKWMGKKAECVALWDLPKYGDDPRNEQALLEHVWKILDEADIVVGWNSKAFDIKKLNDRFLAYGFRPPSPYKQVDVMQERKKISRGNSNKLDNCSQEWGQGRKTKHQGFELWELCMQRVGTEKQQRVAQRKMVTYCKRDVNITAKDYVYLRPWMATHPNLNVWSGRSSACPVCQKEGTLIKRGFVGTPTRRRQQYQCVPEKGGCGKYPTGELIPLEPNSRIVVR